MLRRAHAHVQVLARAVRVRSRATPLRSRQHSRRRRTAAGWLWTPSPRPCRERSSEAGASALLCVRPSPATASAAPSAALRPGCRAWAGVSTAGGRAGLGAPSRRPSARPRFGSDAAPPVPTVTAFFSSWVRTFVVELCVCADEKKDARNQRKITCRPRARPPSYSLQLHAFFLGLAV